MNKARRREISAIIERLEACKADLDCLREEEQGCFDSLPEALQDAEKGETMQENADDLENACDEIDNIIEGLQEVIER